MNVNDVKVAAGDLIEGHGVSPNENVYVQGVHGAELIDGFDIAEANDFSGVFVLDSSRKPAVSSRVVSELEDEIERLREILTIAEKELWWGNATTACERVSGIIKEALK